MSEPFHFDLDEELEAILRAGRPRSNRIWVGVIAFALAVIVLGVIARWTVPHRSLPPSVVAQSRAPTIRSQANLSLSKGPPAPTAYSAAPEATGRDDGTPVAEIASHHRRSAKHLRRAKDQRLARASSSKQEASALAQGITPSPRTADSRAKFVDDKMHDQGEVRDVSLVEKRTRAETMDALRALRLR